ncbi:MULTISPECIES: helix-turn-helix domain-containing protein [Brevibacillus]|uniref:helix-turn-helix domain-containing protein n=1 Tax=Brevibacillus TaxID=55080 RepID=UPI0028525779|nr:helix-turn-helix transcriptional regulator [Brevibacillus laterosporus]
MYESLTFTSLGELIKEKREEFGITLSELSRRTGVSKGIISEIEPGETKRPELRNLKLIADTINIPYEDIIDRYINVELRIDILEAFLAEAVEIANISLLTKVAIKFEILKKIHSQCWNICLTLPLLSKTMKRS